MSVKDKFSNVGVNGTPIHTSNIDRHSCGLSFDFILFGF